MAIATSEQSVVDSVPHQLYIGGEWRDGSAGTLPVEDPATGETLTEVADATPEDADAALQAATDAFKDFRNMPPRERGDILRRAYDMIMERQDDLALLMTLEMGKPVAESKAEIVYAANFFRWYSEEAVRINGRYTINENGKGRVLTMKQPIGPCLFITPWNFPLAMGTRKIGPAIATGCTCVVKPAKQTPLSMLALAQILEEAGLPGGVVNVITASSSGSIMQPLIEDPRTREFSASASSGGLTTPLPGVVAAVAVQEGQAVTAGEVLMVIEAMKMEHSITAPHDGEVRAIRFARGDRVPEGSELLSLSRAGDKTS